MKYHRSLTMVKDLWKYTAQDESQVANIARGEAECYICHEILIKSCIFYTNEAAVF